MARYTGPRNKLSRQVGEDLGLKSNSLKVAKRLSIRPGMHGAKRRRKLSDFGIQLQEKQKVKYIYGVLEKQLRRLYEEASTADTATGEGLLRLLELRLDNIIYRSGWAPTRSSARQLVSHGHVLVNGKKMDVPSHRVKVGDVVSFKAKATSIPLVKELIADKSGTPQWLEKKEHIVKVKLLPARSDISELVQEQLIVEYYSR